MDFSFTPEELALQESVKQVAAKLTPLAVKSDESDQVDPEITRICAEAGLYQYVVPKEYGGAGVRTTNLCIIREGLSPASLQADTTFAMQGLGTLPIVLGGSEAQKRKYLSRVGKGEILTTFALTEPEGGSDVVAMATTGARQGNSYVINGKKRFISQTGAADFYAVFVKTDATKGAKGLSGFIVEKGTPGFDDSRKISLLFPHCIGEPVFTDCRVPLENLLGQEGDGMKLAMGTLNIMRTSVGASAVGMASGALEAAIAYARRRHVFGQNVIDFQATQFKLADMATSLDAAKLLVYRSAWMRDLGGDTPIMESSMAKLFATDTAHRIIDEALQIHGGNGLVKGMLVERLYRGIRALRIYEGTSEIQKLTIARQMLKKVAK